MIFLDCLLSTDSYKVLLSFRKTTYSSNKIFFLRWTFHFLNQKLNIHDIGFDKEILYLKKILSVISNESKIYKQGMDSQHRGVRTDRCCNRAVF